MNNDTNRCEALNANGKKRCGTHAQTLNRIVARTSAGLRKFHLCTRHMNATKVGKRMQYAVQGSKLQPSLGADGKPMISAI